MYKTLNGSSEIYRIQDWGQPYFVINGVGHVAVVLHHDPVSAVDLFQLTQSLQNQGLMPPFLLHFPDILTDRIERLTGCFQKAIARYQYRGNYQGTFPIKCNHQRYSLESVIPYTRTGHMGLEVGTKSELVIAIALLNTPNVLLICHGCKDRQYLKMVYHAQRLGHNVIIVIEQLREMDLAIHMSQACGVQPRFGIRAQLTRVGDHHQFGLTFSEIVAAIAQLRAANLLESLQLLHFHLGSQMTTLQPFQLAIREASQLYVELAQSGASMQYLDVGGGLGVDYSGAGNAEPASKNYSMEDYADTIVATVQSACQPRQQPVPILISENGSALTAYQSVLLCDVVQSKEVVCQLPESPLATAHPLIRQIYNLYQSMTPSNSQAVYYELTQCRTAVITQFSQGNVNLWERAMFEQWYQASCAKLLSFMGQSAESSPLRQSLETMIAAVYTINLSIFQSLPDSWAIHQLFPIMPIHRLNESPNRLGILADLTCDGDGKIARFIDSQGGKNCLELHSLRPEEPYFLGMFLVGAYQESLGNLHNLLGKINTVYVKAKGDSYSIKQAIAAENIADILGRMHYEMPELLAQVQQQVEQALEGGKISQEESQQILAYYQTSLAHSPYFSTAML